MNPYSITSNEAKLFKHLDSLQSIQKGVPKPVMLLISPTNRCNSNCAHCCFKDRDKSLEQDLEYIETVVTQFNALGIKSVEYTGGGEPTMYHHINKLIDFCDNLLLQQGMNTNCLGVVENLVKLKWLRVAMNVFDSGNDKMIDMFKDNVSSLLGHVKITSCYIVAKEIGLDNIGKVIDYANKMNITTRIAPDCIQEKKGIKRTIHDIKNILKIRTDNEYCFCSDFNVYLDKRPNDFCAMHLLKPILYTDGYVYVCPSSELDINNGRDLIKKYRVCRGDESYEYYNKGITAFHHDCEYCKYAKQNELLYYLLMETENNAFI